MLNDTLTWDMIDHPTLLYVYDYFHNITFFITTILMAFAVFVILKKSTPEMSYYKYMLVNMMLWVYILDLYFFLWKPVTLLPYYLLYSTGLFSYLPRESIMYVCYFFGFIIYSNTHAVSLAVNFRISQIFFESKIHYWMNNWKYFMRYAIISFIGIELYWSMPFISFSMYSYNADENLKNVIMEQPVFVKILVQEPLTGCDMQGGCEPIATLIKFNAVLFLSFVTLHATVTFALYYKKEIALRKTLNFSQSYKINQMLFRALTIQLIMIVFLFILPIGFIIVISIIRFKYSNFYAQLFLFPILLYPIIDVFVLMYFVTPYRRYVKSLLVKLKLMKITDIVVQASAKVSAISSTVNIRIIR